jgi:hypothetical protein
VIIVSWELSELSAKRELFSPLIGLLVKSRCFKVNIKRRLQACDRLMEIRKRTGSRRPRNRGELFGVICWSFIKELAGPTLLKA